MEEILPPQSSNSPTAVSTPPTPIMTKSKLPILLIIFGILSTLYYACLIFFVIPSLLELYKSMGVKANNTEITYWTTILLFIYSIFEIGMGIRWNSLQKIHSLTTLQRKIGLVIFLFPIIVAFFGGSTFMSSVISPIYSLISSNH